jgi:predicted RNase H-like nuclease (RuvC/YqgF family)
VEVAVEYRLYMLDSAGHFEAVIEMECETDEEAITAAEQRSDPRAAELWRRDVQVATLRRKI